MTPSGTGWDASFDRRFDEFFRDRLRPVVDGVAPGRRAALRRAILVGAGVFLVVAATTALLTAAQMQLVWQHAFGYGMMLLALFPLSLAVIAFSLVYVLLIRRLTLEFRKNLLGRLAEFIHPGAVHETGRAIPEDELTQNRLFDGLGRPISGSERFRLVSGSIACEFAEVRLEKKAAAGPPLTGVFLTARFTSRLARTIAFPAASPGQGPEGAPPNDSAASLAEQASRRGGICRMHGADDRVRIALLSEHRTHGAGNTPGDDFDFANSREFCRAALLCLAMARALEPPVSNPA